MQLDADDNNDSFYQPPHPIATNVASEPAAELAADNPEETAISTSGQEFEA